jgi:hypothetical protein
MRTEYVVMGFVLMLIVLAILLALLGALPNVPAEVQKLIDAL